MKKLQRLYLKTGAISGKELAAIAEDIIGGLGLSQVSSAKKFYAKQRVQPTDNDLILSDVSLTKDILVLREWV